MSIEIESDITITSERIRTSKPRRFEGPDGWLHYHVRVALTDVRLKPTPRVVMVVYELDESYEDERYQVSVDQSNEFAIKIWASDFFQMTAKVLFDDHTYRTIPGVVSWEGRVEARA